MKLITNTIICLIIAFASNMLSIKSAVAEDEQQQPPIVAVPSEDPNAPDTVYE